MGAGGKKLDIQGEVEAAALQREMIAGQ